MSKLFPNLKRDYPNVTEAIQRDGSVLFRFRKTGLKSATSTPRDGEPYTPAFDRWFKAVTKGQKPQGAEVVRMPGAARPKSFDLAFANLKASEEWSSLEDTSKVEYTRQIETFLNTPIAAAEGRWGCAAVADMTRADLKAYLAQFSDRPGQRKNRFVAISKLIDQAIDDEWIAARDRPTYKLGKQPKFKKRKPWSDAVRAAFVAAYPVGTMQHAAYAICLWLGTRRSDATRLRADQRQVRRVLDQNGDLVVLDGFWIVIHKNRKRRGDGEPAFLAMTPMLEEALANFMHNDGGPILRTPDKGLPFSDAWLTMSFKKWTAAAGIEPGYTPHGLRHTHGGLLGDAGTTEKESMAALTHATSKEAVHYSKSADNARLNARSKEKLVKLVAVRS